MSAETRFGLILSLFLLSVLVFALGIARGWPKGGRAWNWKDTWYIIVPSGLVVVATSALAVYFYDQLVVE